MTARAERYKVFKSVRFFISLILTLDIPKRSERYDMMHVQFSSQFAFGSLAMLTTVVVALTRGAALSVPVWAIVFFVSALPIGVFFANSILRSPDTKAGHIAKVISIILYPKWYSLNNSATSRAIDRNSTVRRVFWADELLRVVLTTTFNTAKEILRPNDFMWRALNWLAAMCTRHRYTTVQFVGCAIFMRRHPTSATRGATKSVITSLHRGSRAMKFITAVLANICRHEKSLTDRLVTCSGFTAISKGVHEVYHILSVRVNPEQYHYTTYVLQTVVKWH